MSSRFLSTTEYGGLLNSVNELIKSFGPKASRHDMAFVAISAAIDGGITDGSGIIGFLCRLGFNPKHAAITLKNGIDGDPKGYGWYRNDAGLYSNHAAVIEPIAA